MAIKEERWIKITVRCMLAFAMIGLIYQYSDNVVVLSQKRELKNSSTKKIIPDIINSTSSVQRSTRKRISYSFIFNGRRYDRYVYDVYYTKCDFDHRNETFPIVIDSLNPQLSFILLHKRDYKYFGYPAPDSMNWVFRCVQPSGSYYLTTAPICPDWQVGILHPSLHNNFPVRIINATEK